VDAAGNARDVARPGLREVLGLKVGGPGQPLWAACTDDEHPGGESCVVAIDPPSGRVLRRACISGEGHELNDLAVASDGTVYVTDSASGGVLRLPAGGTGLEVLVPDGRLRGANGIALGPDGAVLLVAHGRGIARITLASGVVGAVENASGSSFVGIDGMALRDRTLFAIANSYGHPRVVRIALDAALARAERADVVESGTPAWDEPTTGALGPDGFYYVADSQMNSGAPDRETVVLKLAY
jgi:hypothetical protein